MILLSHTKTGTAKYLGHLDMLRCFKRIFLRANINVERSQGFNPHPLFFFPQPLGLGIESECDLVVVGAEFSSDILKRLNDISIPGVQFTNCKKIEKDINLAAIIVSSIFLVKFDYTENTKQQLENFLAQKEIIITIKTKSGIKEKNVKQLILNHEWNDSGILLHLTCGNNNLRPDYLINGFKEWGKTEFDFKCIRTDVFLSIGEKSVCVKELFELI